MNLAFLLTREPSLSTQARSYAALLLGEAQRAGEITKQTLSFFRSTTTPTEVRMPKLLDSIVASKKGKVDRKRIAIKSEIKGSGLAWGFPGELGQVFSNLIENAIDAVEECGQVRIRTRDLNTKPRDLCVSICDNGCGMTSQALERIFEPFFTTKEQRGSGLGLWVTRGIIARHGGTLRVRTSQAPNRHGTIFSVTLPAGIPTGPRTGADVPVAA
jgi:signal transduction histidine kinase